MTSQSNPILHKTPDRKDVFFSLICMKQLLTLLFIKQLHWFCQESITSSKLYQQPCKSQNFIFGYVLQAIAFSKILYTIILLFSLETVVLLINFMHSTKTIQLHTIMCMFHLNKLNERNLTQKCQTLKYFFLLCANKEV